MFELARDSRLTMRNLKLEFRNKPKHSKPKSKNRNLKRACLEFVLFDHLDSLRIFGLRISSLSAWHPPSISLRTCSEPLRAHSDLVAALVSVYQKSLPQGRQCVAHDHARALGQDEQRIDL